ncbi:MAG: hypothetical protein RL550_720 [Actinomycetota bacterium]
MGERPPVERNEKGLEHASFVDAKGQSSCFAVPEIGHASGIGEMVDLVVHGRSVEGDHCWRRSLHDVPLIPTALQPVRVRVPTLEFMNPSWHL